MENDGNGDSSLCRLLLPVGGLIESFHAPVRLILRRERHEGEPARFSRVLIHGKPHLPSRVVQAGACDM